ncbi:MAG TPA: carbohydrate hydrolase, partial [Clostridiales bacterium]|nr:carbohydrate hydrolase [Clostridiales bacterium]
MEFLGYRRPDGSVGIRNHVLIMSTVGCAAEAARVAAGNLYGAVSFMNQNGCGESSGNLRRTRDVLIGLAANPNIYGVVAIGLG